MMNTTTTPCRVMVVDDRLEMREVMRSSVESLGSRVEVTAVPSGEEALLEMQFQHVDLLIADVLLAGINGMELMKKAKDRLPDLKVILVTGVLDRQLRHAAASAGADAFFLKPMDPTEFLNAVDHCLRLVDSATPVETEDGEQIAETSVPEQLEKLRREVDAAAVIMTDEYGRIQAQAGNLPEAAIDPGVIPLVMASLSASSKVSMFVGAPNPRDLSYYAGKKFDIYAAHVGNANAMVVVLKTTGTPGNFGLLVETLYQRLRDLDGIVDHWGEANDLQEQSEEGTAGFNPMDVEVVSPVDDPVLQDAADKMPGSEEVEAFWEAVTQASSTADDRNPEVLSYDQAHELGLTPEDEN